MHTRGTLPKDRHRLLRSLVAWAVVGTFALHLSWHVVSGVALAAQPSVEPGGASSVVVRLPERVPVASPFQGRPFAGSIPEMREAHFASGFSLPPVASRAFASFTEAHATPFAVTAANGRSPPGSVLVAS